MSLFRPSTTTRIDEKLYEAETALTNPDVRRIRSRVEALLHPEFTETGSTGEVYDRETMIEMMATESPGEVIISDFSVDPLSDDVAVVTYRSVGLSGNETRRTSVWVSHRGNWRLRHHQGTRVPDMRGHRSG